MIVLDASAAGCILLFDEEALPDTVAAAIDAGQLAAPAHWPLEVGSLLLSARRRGRITPAQHREALEDARGLRVAVSPDGGRHVWTSVTDLAIEHGLTTYDAAYLEQAIRTGASLATGDRDLANAARRSGVAVLDARP